MWGEVVDHWNTLIYDVLLITILSVVHVAATTKNDTSLLADDPDSAAKAADLVRGTTGGGLTVAGILIPVTLLTVTIGTSNRRDALTATVLVYLFVAATWLMISLTFGVMTAWIAGFQGLTRNVLKENLVSILLGLQLIFLLIGAFRLVWGLFSLATQFL